MTLIIVFVHKPLSESDSFLDASSQKWNKSFSVKVTTSQPHFLQGPVLLQAINIAGCSSEKKRLPTPGFRFAVICIFLIYEPGWTFFKKMSFRPQIYKITCSGPGFCSDAQPASSSRASWAGAAPASFPEFPSCWWWACLSPLCELLGFIIKNQFHWCIVHIVFHSPI